jgi:UDP-glucuronate 4-epimerase
VYNIGSDRPVKVLRCIEVLEACLGRTTTRNWLPMQPGDVPVTWADVSDLAKDFGYRPEVALEEGVARFVDWYRAYYGTG